MGKIVLRKFKVNGYSGYKIMFLQFKNGFFMVKTKLGFIEYFAKVGSEFIFINVVLFLKILSKCSSFSRRFISVVLPFLKKIF